MGVLGNLDHERFCQAFHKRVWAGEKRSTARTAAYRETMYKGDSPDDAAIAPNARRLVQRKDVKARIAELADFAGKMAGIDSAWAMVESRVLYDQVKAWNLDDYLAPPDAQGNRYYDLGKVPREQLALLSELTIEESDEPGTAGRRELRKIKFKGPSKPGDLVAILALMARIAGWEAPKKVAPTTPDGEHSWNPLSELLNEIDGRTRGLPSPESPPG